MDLGGGKESWEDSVALKKRIPYGERETETETETELKIGFRYIYTQLTIMNEE